MKHAERIYFRQGHCPICERDVEFSADNHWYRDYLSCSGCGSIPRERALALVLAQRLPMWRGMAIHESSPANRGISVKLRRECKKYTATQFYRGRSLGAVVDGFRNENLEQQTFQDGIFDLVVTLDVMEHVNEPDVVFRDIARTLKVGGVYLFTVPTYKGKVTSERRARYGADGSIELFAEAEYHGNPVSDAGSLVTFHYGYDLPDMISEWCGMDVDVVRFHNHYFGVIGEFTEVYIATKRAPIRSNL